MSFVLEAADLSVCQPASRHTWPNADLLPFFLPLAIQFSQAWRDFLNKQSETPILPGSTTSATPGSSGSAHPYHTPTLLDALKSRPLRAVAAICGALVALSLLSAAAGGPGNAHLRSAIGGYGATPYWEDKSLSGLQQGSGGTQPYYVKDPSNGFLYPPDIQPAHLNPYQRANATFVSLVRNNERAPNHPK